MMLRLTLATRMALIILVGLIAVWIVLLASHYWARGGDMESARPPPARIAALVELLEGADSRLTPLILTAATTAAFEPRLVSAGSDAETILPLVDISERRPYEQVLGGRPLTMTISPDLSFGHRLRRLAALANNGLEFRIGLRTGQSLVIDTRSPVAVNRFGLPVGFFAGLVGTVIALLALLVMQRETKPLVRLAAAVDRVDLSNAPVPLPQPRRSAPEIRAVINAFNRLQGRLSGMMRARMALIGGISHDVRTFATRLRLRADFIPEEMERQRAIADIDDMVRLLDDALLSSRAGAGELSQEIVDFQEIVRAEVADRQASDARIVFTPATGAGGANVLGDRLALRRIVANVTDNALKYGQAAQVQTLRDGEAIVLVVDDEGPGIPPDQREILLEPFSRLESSRSRGTGGAGLGLSIVRTLAEAHDGTVEISDAPGRGARVSVRLPLFDKGRS
ncbi:sensor histidine kinase [Labrys okinawensis]|uniref:sensor histidine kinase n=1 Tax=Labrys okinawensis TaxID=346911 RepID=UPI0039BC9678